MVAEGQGVGFLVEMVGWGALVTAGGDAQSFVLRSLHFGQVGVSDVGGPDGGSVIQDRAAERLIGKEKGLFVLAPRGRALMMLFLRDALAAMSIAC